MFRASICPSSGVLGFIPIMLLWCSALGVVAEVLRSRCVVLCTGVSFVSDWHGQVGGWEGSMTRRSSGLGGSLGLCSKMSFPSCLFPFLFVCARGPGFKSGPVVFHSSSQSFQTKAGDYLVLGLSHFLLHPVHFTDHATIPRCS